MTTTNTAPLPDYPRLDSRSRKVDFPITTHLGPLSLVTCRDLVDLVIGLGRPHLGCIAWLSFSVSATD